MTLLIISFIAGVLTILAPCILPLLPVVIGGSLSESENKKKPYIITASLAASVIVFTLLLKASTLVIDIPPSFWTWFSGGILIALGLVLIFPALWERLPINALINRKSQALLAEGSKKESVWGDVIMGAALGPVFSTCSPTYFVILATVLPASLSLGILYLLSYTVGLSLMLILVALLGQRLVGKLSGAADPHGWVKRGTGILILLVGLAIIAGVDKKIETAILDAGFFDVTSIEQRLLNTVDTQPNDAPQGEMASTQGTEATQGTKAPEITGAAGYINTNGEPITIAGATKHGIVLVDFWTYSCINCRRTTPYLNAWYERYADKGLTIIGVHTPEFAFEQKYENVAAAVKDLGIEYPVVLDNEYATWNAFKNRYWPRKYLIDQEGNIIYDHIGEGGYEETEAAIQNALKNIGALKKDMPLGNVSGTTEVKSSSVGSPETYFGAARNSLLANGMQGQEGVQQFVLPTSVAKNKLYLKGPWNIAREYAVTTEGGGAIVYRFDAKNVYMVLASTKRMDVSVYIDGALVDAAHAGSDVHSGVLTVDDERLYHLYSGSDYGSHTLEVRATGPGLTAYTFTFG